MTDHDDIVDLLHRAVDVTPAGDHQIGAIAIAAHRRRMVHRIAAATAGTAVLVALVVMALVLPSDPPATRLDLAGAPTRAGAPAGLRQLPQAPLDTRWGAFSGVDRGLLLIWGGYAWPGEGVDEGARDDGAVFTDGEWALLPAGPLSPRMRSNGVAAWMESGEFWIVGGTGGSDGGTPLRDAAAYRPAPGGQPGAGTWRELPAVPEAIAGGAVIDGETMVAVAPGSGGSRSVYALQAGASRWEAVDPLPAPSAVDNSDLHILDAGGYLVAVGQGEMFRIPDGLHRGAGWERVPPPDGARAFGTVRGAVASSGTDGSLTVLLPDGTYRFDADAGTWARIAGGLRPDPPQAVPLLATHDGTLVAVDVAGGRVHALSDGGWTPLPRLDHPRVDAVVETLPAPQATGEDHDHAGSDIFVWGGMGSEEPASAQGVRLHMPPAGDR